MPLINMPAFQASPLLDLSPIAQGLRERQRQLEVQQQRDLQERQFSEGQRQFNAQNALAVNQDQRAAAMAPLQLQSLKVEIANRARNGAQEAELFPLIRRAKELENQLLTSKAEGNDTERQLLRSLGLADQPGGQPPQQPQGAPQQQPRVQPQSFEGQGPGPQPMLQPAADTGGGGDPMLIPTQAGPAQGQPAQQGQPTARDVIQSMDPAKRAQFGLSFMGKGDAAKVIGEQADKLKMSKDARNELDKKELNTSESIARLNAIADTYRPEYLTWKNQAIQGANWFKGKLGANITPEQRQSRMQFEGFKQNTLTNLNQYIKDITGSAMGVEEARRIIASMPNMEDDPAGFEAKLNNVRTQSALAVARYRYLRENEFKGQPWDVGRAEATFPLQKMQDTIRGRAAQYYKDIKSANPQLGDQEVYGLVKKNVAREFGMDI